MSRLQLLDVSLSSVRTEESLLDGSVSKSRVARFSAAQGLIRAKIWDPASDTWLGSAEAADQRTELVGARAKMHSIRPSRSLRRRELLGGIGYAKTLSSLYSAQY